jgi:hypothetical protein
MQVLSKLLGSVSAGTSLSITHNKDGSITKVSVGPLYSNDGGKNFHRSQRSETIMLDGTTIVSYKTL